jgi:hypothetical protein
VARSGTAVHCRRTVSRPPRIVPAALALLIAGLLAAALVVVADRRGGAATGLDERAAAVVAELQAFVESARGLRFKDPVDVEVVDDAAFRRLLTGGEPAEEPDAGATAGVLRALGLLGGGEDLGPSAEIDADLVAGFYDTETRELVVRGTRLTPFVRQVLVHELTHALDDQHFGLDRDLPDGEAALAFAALAEGDAIVVEARYLASLPAAERQEAADEEQATFGVEGLGGDVPDVLVELADFPYRDGPELVTALLGAGGRARLDAAFRAPPTTSAEVLHPERFLAGRGRAPVPTVAADGRVVDSGPLGELVLQRVLAGSVPEDRAARAAAGWAGDRYVAWAVGRRTCVRAVVVLDSPAEAAELAAALRPWVADQAGAVVVPPASGAASVTLTRCA